MENLIVPGDAVEKLFALQGEDALLGQLEHQIITLPEREKLISVLETKKVTEDLIFVKQAESVELRKNEKRLELELSSIETRLKEVDEKLYSGVITTEKEAKSLQDEIGHLKERQDALESELLEILSQIEDLTTAINEVNSQLEVQNKDIQILEDAIKRVENELNQKVLEAKDRREESVKVLTDEILKSYEAHRVHFPSDAVVRFNGPTCNGCHLTMSAMETDRIKGLEVGALTECSECGRLVVR
ncbi:MAG: hypothetical protein MK195_06640 [Acidimicrobiales bacterium]|nr:hypothetical protein [Acidimicrobiales bacterium]